MDNKRLSEILKKNRELEKLAASQDAVIKSLKKELEKHTKLAADATETLESLAKDAGNKVENTLADAASDVDSVSDETKDSIIEAVSKIDADLAADLTHELTQLEIEDEKLTGDKFASCIRKTVIDKLALSTRRFSEGTVRPRSGSTTDKVASRTGAVSGFQASLAEDLAVITKR